MAALVCDQNNQVIEEFFNTDVLRLFFGCPPRYYMDVLWLFYGWSFMRDIDKYSLNNKLTKILMEIERFHGKFQASKLFTPHFVTELKKTTIITSSGASTRIEGAILTDDEIKKFVSNGCKISKMSSRSEREVAGYVKALNYIYKHYNEIEVTEKNLRELHQILTSELTSDQLPKKQRGAYKDITNHVIEKNLDTGKETIWFKTTPPGPMTETAMRDLVDNFNKFKQSEEIHPIILIAIFIVHFLGIHPFRDGNGRLSRLISVWLMLKFGYLWIQFTSHEKVIEDNKENYYLSLRETQNTFQAKKVNYDRWLYFFITVILKQTQIIQSILQKQSPVSAMNKNEQLVYEIIKSNHKCNIGFILDQVEMTRAGLKTLLKRLIEQRIIKVEGVGKGSKYYI
ncbi:MAG: Fic family protein [Oligoflexia bacterium]|nr:Fic family protein [Oligoflexia bacterium]MBF0365147.1 Fic family protein [Oligoflexia bacterium]